MRLIDADVLMRDWLHQNPNDTIKLNDVLDSIVDMPTVYAEPVRVGRWIRKNENEPWECNQCGDGGYGGENPRLCGFYYCPKCGSKMY